MPDKDSNIPDSSKSNPAQEWSSSTGWVKVPRTIREHWLWDDPRKLKWWIDILMEVNHSPRQVNLGFRLIDCGRGQSVKSIQTWAKRWRVDVGIVRRFFTLLQEANMIKTEGVKKSTRITVCDYENYNDGRRDSIAILSSSRRDNEFEVTTNKNVKKERIKEGKNISDSDSDSDFDFAQAWEAYQKKQDRAAALKIWTKLKPEEKQKALEHIPAYVQSTPDPQYRKHLKTYLNQKTFLEPIFFPKNKTGTEIINSQKDWDEKF